MMGNRGAWRPDIYVCVGEGEMRGRGKEGSLRGRRQEETSRNEAVWFAWISKKPNELALLQARNSLVSEQY